MTEWTLLLDFDGTISINRGAMWKELHKYFGTENGMKDNQEAFYDGEFGEHGWATRDSALWLNKELPNEQWVGQHFPPIAGLRDGLLAIRNMVMARGDSINIFIISSGIRKLIRDFVAYHALPIDDIIAHDVSVDNNRRIKGIFEGVTDEFIFEDKMDMYRYLLSMYQFDDKHTIMVGNGSNDKELLIEAEFGIAINPRNDDVWNASDEHLYTNTFEDVTRMIMGYILSREVI